jgi:hypothetical protein
MRRASGDADDQGLMEKRRDRQYDRQHPETDDDAHGTGSLTVEQRP